MVKIMTVLLVNRTLAPSILLSTGLLCLLGMGVFVPSTSHGLTFDLPEKGDIVGYIKTTVVRHGDNLSTIGRKYDIGGYEMKEANQGVSYLSPQPGTHMTIPSRFILPSGPRKGIVVNLAEMRLYFYHPNSNQVSTYPIGIGKDGWDTPLGKTRIVRKRENPTWVVPDSILENYARKGKSIEKRMPPGPNNPLGEYAMNLGFKNIVIHGTPYPRGIGIRSSHGCLRMLPEDIENLYYEVPMGTQVRIVHEPNKIGKIANTFYLEAHVPLSEPQYQSYESLNQKIRRVMSRFKSQSIRINWGEAESLRKRANGLPEAFGRLIP